MKLTIPLALVFLAGVAPAAAQDVINRPASELVGGSWLNTANDAPVSLAARKGRVTIVHFWTFG